MSLKVLVDSREAASQKDVLKALLSLNIPVKIKYLEAGDYFISPYIIERKSTSDFIRSIKDKSLWEQLDLMKSVEGAEQILLIEGSFTKALKFSKFSVNAIYGAIWTIIDKFKTQLVWTSNSYHTALFLAAVYRNLASPKKQKLIPVRVKPRILSEDDELRSVVEGYVGVGSSTAVALLKHFGTIKNIVNATKEELKEVSGIGEKLANKIYEINNRKFRGE